LALSKASRPQPHEKTNKMKTKKKKKKTEGSAYEAALDLVL
jgi:hypothetical protein